MDLQDLQELLDDLQWSPPTSPLLQNDDEGQDRLTPTQRQTPLIDREMDNISSYSSGDEVEPIGQVGRVEYFWDDPMTPIYGMFSKSLDTKVVVELVASGVDKAAKIVPSPPRGNYAFMYDLSYLENWKDVLSDEFGAWCPNGTNTMWYKSEVENTLKMGLRWLVSFSKLLTSVIIVFVFVPEGRQN